MSSSENLGEKVKRPMNAFILWSRERRRELANADPNLHNFEISKRLGIEWNHLAAAEKKRFYEEAQKLKEEHRKNHPDYKYHPRRKPRRKFTPMTPTGHFRMAYFLPPEKYQQPRNVNPWLTMRTANQFVMKQYPQYLGNGVIPVTYYGIHATPALPSVGSSSGKSAGEILPQTFTREGPFQREEFVRRASESSLRTGDKVVMPPLEKSLETNKYEVYSASGHVCLGCKGVTDLHRRL